MKTPNNIEKKSKVCIVSCSVLKKELQQLTKQGTLNAELVMISKNFHVDYALLEKNVRKILEQTKRRGKQKIILVYGDLCLGQDNEMKKLADEYGVVKVEALNCIDCQLGGKGAFSEVDPEHNLMFMGPGMIEFFRDMKEKMLKEGLDEASFAIMFNGIKGFVILDTCGDGDKCKIALEKLGMGVPVLEIRKIGLAGIQTVISDAINRA